jgi:hypothetical protein
MADKHLFYILPFIIGIIAGIILLYIFKGQRLEIVDYPKANDNRIFTDANGIKFKYSTKEVNCDENEKTLRDYPLQS